MMVCRSSRPEGTEICATSLIKMHTGIKLKMHQNLLIVNDNYCLEIKLNRKKVKMFRKLKEF